MITLASYIGNKAATEKQRSDALRMLARVNDLLRAAQDRTAYRPIPDPDTGTQISGARGGSGDGGFRMPDSTTGAANSKHKQGRAVDVFDPNDLLDKWLTDSILEEFNLYREAPAATPGWCHLQDAPPNSGRRTFQP